MASSKAPSSPATAPAPPAEAPEAASEAPAAEVLEWCIHLARREPAKAVVVVGLALISGALGLALFHNWLFALFAAGVLIAATGEFLFPVRYRLTAEDAELRGPFSWRRIRWTEVKRVYAANEEIKLSPLAHPGPREAFRGVLLRCEGNRDRVLDAIRRFRDAAGAPTGE
jgi:hypothetical protein